jgi:SanA protein
LYDRVATAAELYRLGKVETLLMSGDGQTNNETSVMHQLAVEMGLPETAILVDEARLRTYESCYRARTVFGLEEVALVTQSFHLPRALLLCDSLGLSAVGVLADRRQYDRVALTLSNIREVFATANAWWEVVVIEFTNAREAALKKA